MREYKKNTQVLPQVVAFKKQSTSAPFVDQRTATTVQLQQQNTMRAAHYPNIIQKLTMDDVKVHFNPDRPAQLNAHAHAHAHAQGTDIQVAPGQEQHFPQLNDTPVTQKMAKNAAEGVVRTVKNAVPDAGNRLFDIIATLGKSIDKNKLKIDVLSSIDSFAPFGTTNINTIATRASVANVTKGAVCDNYQEMAIAEMDRSGVGVGETVRAESYPGHSYVSVVDPVHNTDRNEDLIVDPWRNMVDKRKDFTFFTKYRNAYTPYGSVAMAGQTDWLDPTISGNYYVRGFLNMSGIPNTGDLQNDMNTYIEQNPGTTALANIYPI